MERCPYCFKPLQDGETCDCRYEESGNAQIEEALRPGTVVGACYLIGGVLGQGGFGITYSGFDLDMQKVIAVKEFFPEGMVTRSETNIESASNSRSTKTVKAINTKNQNVFRKSQELFYREAIAPGKLSDLPNVVHAYRIFQENNTAYIIMDFVEGTSLKDMVFTKGKLSEKGTIVLSDPVPTVSEKISNHLFPQKKCRHMLSKR